MFHFVDRIVLLDPGRRSLGVRHVSETDPFVVASADGRRRLLSCIVGEALGQLGAWNVISGNGFRLRPVAGIARNVRIVGEVDAGDSLLLETTIDSVDDQAVRYHAVASVRGETVMELEEGLGPFLPLEDFNDPREVRAHFERIHRPGSVAEALTERPQPEQAPAPGVPWLGFDEIRSRETGGVTAVKTIDAGWPFFVDHFPRKSVFPMTLLLECLLGLGAELLDEGLPAEATLRPQNIRRVKMSRFLEPGATVVAHAKIRGQDRGTTRIAFRCEVEGERALIAEADYATVPEASYLNGIGRRAVAVTGIGMVTPLGNDTATTWNGLLAGKSGVAPIASFDPSGFPTRIAAEVKGFDPGVIDDRKLLKYAVPFTTFALAAADEAIRDAGIRPNPSDAERWGLVSGGSGMMTAQFDFLQKFHRKLAATGGIDFAALGREGEEIMSSPEFAKHCAVTGQALLQRRFGIRGYSANLHTACASGGQALGLAMRAIRSGECDRVLAGGYDSMITPVGLTGFCLLTALSTENDAPEAASRPFDRTRNGFVLGEGAAFLVLEEWRAARDRGAKIYAELCGEGNSLSSYRITDSHPSGDGPIQSMRSALHDAGEAIESVDYVNAHGTSTQMNDLCETNAVKEVFGRHATGVPMSSTKSQMGHLIAAAGAVEGAICALAIHDSVIPMTSNLNHPDPQCDLDYVPNAPRARTVDLALSNSFGFGGSNSSVLFAAHGSPGSAVSAMSRIVVTGLGCLSAVGAGVATTWEAVLSGQSGIEEATSWDAGGWRYRLAGEIKEFQPRKLVSDRKLLKVVSRQDVIGLNAVDQAITHSGILDHRESLADPTSFNDRTGVFVGSPGTKYRQQHDYLPVLTESGEDIAAFGDAAMEQIHPMWLLRTLPNNVLAYAGIKHGFKGANENVTAHGISGAQAIAEACRFLRSGEIDRAVVVGYDSVSEPEALVYYGALGLLSAEALRPFDAARDGTILGEGGGALVLETLDAARERGVTIYGEVLGCCVTSEGGILSVEEDGDGLIRAMRGSLADAGREAAEVGMVTAHANGSRQSDRSEALAIGEVFGAAAPPVTGFKWALGHTVAASGAIESILTLLSLRERRVPGIATLRDRAPDCSNLEVSGSEQEARSPIGLVTTRGFAGLHCCILLSADVA